MDIPEKNEMIRAILAGVAYWGICAVFILILGNGMSTSSGTMSLMSIAGILLLIGAWYFFAPKGWDWLSESQGGSIGHLIKFVAIFVLVLTVIGCIPVIYWTGKGIMRYAGVD
jgi:hypothetical protein